MPRPRRPVSPVPEGPAEEDQLQTRTRLRMEEEEREPGIIFRAGEVWEGGKMEETRGVIFYEGQRERGAAEIIL